MTAPPLLEVQALGARAGSHRIIDGVTFDARAGEITVVVGPNGAGKTTLLETTVGLRRSDSGSVRLGGRSLARFGDRAKAFAFLPDAGVLPPEASVRTLVSHAIARGGRRAELGGLRDGLAIETLMSKTVAMLSRGEHQRLALFCTMVLARPVVVLDEPFSAFDPLQLRSVLSVVRGAAAAGTAIVASIHEMADAEKIADRVLLLSHGRAVAFGDPASLREQAGSSDASLEDVFIALLSRSTHAS